MPNAIAHYLATGESDCLRYGIALEDMKRADGELVAALLAEVKRRTCGRRSPRVPKHFDPVAFTRGCVEPMVRGLFPRVEQELVLSMLEGSTVFVTRQNIEQRIRGETFLSSAWTLANLYLHMMGCELLSDEAPRLVGFSEHQTCYVSASYFHESDPFGDFVVHEAAHVFHNCKRETIGLPHTRRKEWLLEIDFRKRETFAYSCEAYSRILALGPRPADRRELADKYAEDPGLSEERLDPVEVVDMVREAVRARNGWKVILRRCAPPPRSRRPHGMAVGPMVPAQDT